MPQIFHYKATRATNILFLALSNPYGWRANATSTHLIVYLIFVLEFFGVETYLQHVSLFNAASKWRWSRSFTMNLIHFDTAENQFFSKSIFTFIAARARPTIIERENSRDFAFALLIKRPFYSLHYLIEKKIHHRCNETEGTEKRTLTLKSTQFKCIQHNASSIEWVYFVLQNDYSTKKKKHQMHTEVSMGCFTESFYIFTEFHVNCILLLLLLPWKLKKIYISTKVLLQWTEFQ